MWLWNVCVCVFLCVVCDSCCCSGRERDIPGGDFDLRGEVRQWDGPGSLPSSSISDHLFLLQHPSVIGVSCGTVTYWLIVSQLDTAHVCACVVCVRVVFVCVRVRACVRACVLCVCGLCVDCL